MATNFSSYLHPVVSTSFVLVFFITSKILSIFYENIKQLSRVKIPNFTILFKYHFTFLVYVNPAPVRLLVGRSMIVGTERYKKYSPNRYSTSRITLLFCVCQCFYVIISLIFIQNFGNYYYLLNRFRYHYHSIESY